MSGRTRLGVVGCGFFARNHLHAWKSLADEGVDIVAVCDVDPDRAREAAAGFDVPTWYGDAAEMLDAENLDLVDIVTQVDSHFPLVELALDARVATIVQKPFGRSLRECREMVAKAETNETFLAVHENFRFQHPHRMIKEIVSSGAIGLPTWGRISFRTGYDIYAGQPYLLEEPRFIVNDLGPHVLDLARVLFGEVHHIQAEVQRRNPNAVGEDTATMLLRCRSGAVCTVECTYGSRRLPDPFPATVLEVEGSEGAVHLGGDLGIEVTSGGQLSSKNGDVAVLDWAERPWHVVQESVRFTCRHVLKRFQGGRAADVSGADNLRTYALCEAAYAAAETGRAVRPEVPPAEV